MHERTPHLQTEHKNPGLKTGGCQMIACKPATIGASDHSKVTTMMASQASPASTVYMSCTVLNS